MERTLNLKLTLVQIPAVTYSFRQLLPISLSKFDNYKMGVVISLSQDYEN